jgi:hypothetical protein
MNPFNWQSEKSVLAQSFSIEPERKSYPQLNYYHRKMAEGTHPRQIRRAGLEVVDQRFKENRN